MARGGPLSTACTSIPLARDAARASDCNARPSPKSDSSLGRRSLQTSSSCARAWSTSGSASSISSWRRASGRSVRAAEPRCSFSSDSTCPRLSCSSRQTRAICSSCCTLWFSDRLRRRDSASRTRVCSATSALRSIAANTAPSGLPSSARSGAALQLRCSISPLWLRKRKSRGGTDSPPIICTPQRLLRSTAPALDRVQMPAGEWLKMAWHEEDGFAHAQHGRMRRAQVHGVAR